MTPTTNLSANPLADLLPDPARGVDFKLGQDGALVQQGTLRLLAWPGSRPSVSCLMVTRGHLFPARFAVECFRRQTWQERELVLVCDGPGSAIESYCRGLDDARIRIVYPAAPAASLGALRNLSLNAARGSWICQWDDDDLYHPQRIELAMLMLQSMQADAMFLSRWTLWAPAARRLGISGSREWEGSMLARAAAVPAYPALARGEDSAVMHAMLARGRVALVDAPWLYTYVQTGANTWNAQHFDAIWRAGKVVAQGAEHDAALAALGMSGLHAEYAQAAMAAAGPG